MKSSYKVFISLSLLGLSSTALIGAYLKPKNTYAAKAETSADWNAAYTGTYSGSYYNGITGTQGMTLKDQLTDLIDGHTVVSYDGLYELYKTSDVRPEDGTIFDMYADWHFSTGSTCGNYSNPGDCYNREHSVPKSWFGNASPMYSDAFHLYPTDGKVNGMRSNYAFGEVGTASWSYTFKGNIQGVSKKGNSSFPGYSGVVFEPADVYKGDFARTYFYFATRYKDKMSSMSGDGTVHFTGSTTYCNLTEYSKNLFLKWHRNDPVSIKEVNRNNAVYAKQKNRNPFIDHPEYAEAIWGDTPIGTGSVKLSQSSISMSYGSAGVSLSATSSDNSQISWTTSNSTVATVSSSTSSSGANITIIPQSVGSATITASAYIDNKTVTASCAVTVTKQISTLSYTGEPTKAEYIDGDSFNPSGLVVTAQYTDNSTENVTDKVTWTPNPLREGTTSVTGTYSGLTITINGLTVLHNDNPVSGTYVIDATSKSQLTTETTSQLVFTETPVTVTINKDSSSTNANNYVANNGQTRVYGGSTFVVSAGGANITSITIGYHSGKTLNGFINGTWTNGTAVQEDNLDVTVTPTVGTSDVSCTIASTSSFTGVTVVVDGGSTPTPPSEKTLVSIATTGQTTSFTEGNVFAYDGTCTATYSDNSSNTVTPTVDSSDVDMSIPGTYTVNLSYTEGSITAETCYDIIVLERDDSGDTFVNTIAECYTKQKGASVSNVYGLYVGSVNNGQSAIIMNGEYGIMLFSQAATGWTENETYIKVNSATLDIYNNLYELKTCNCTVVTDLSVINSQVAPVVTYGITGNESASDLTIANRLSLMSGVVTKIEYRNNSTYHDGWNTNYDNRVTMTVNDNSIELFIKKADCTSALGTAFSNSLNNTSEVTVQGYSSFYNTFQVQFKALVEADTSYTAESFATDLLNLTNGACTNSFNNNWSNVYSTLAPIWVTLEGANYYAKLPAEQKLILKNASTNENGSTIEEAMARYEHIITRYGNLNDFIGRNPTNASARFAIFADTNTLLLIMVAISITTISVLGFTFFLKKRKTHR